MNKLIRSTLWCSLVMLTGCNLTSEGTKQVTSSMIAVSSQLQARHLETIDAYIASLKAAQHDIQLLSEVMTKDKQALQQLKDSHLQAQQQAAIEYALAQFRKTTQQQLLTPFDQTIEDVFWPSIVEKHSALKNKEAAFKQQVTNHYCIKQPQSCSSAGMEEYQKAWKQYRSYSVAAEYLLHLGYEQETHIWQKLIAAYQESMDKVTTRAANIKVDDDLTISNQQVLDELNAIQHKLAMSIEVVTKERVAIEKSWQATEQALDYLQAEINKPSVWQLVLQGASQKTRGIIFSYTQSAQKKLEGILGSELSSALSDSVRQGLDNIVHSGFNELEQSANQLLSGVAETVNNKADKFIEQQTTAN